MLGHCRRRWPNIKPALDRRVVFDGRPLIMMSVSQSGTHVTFSHCCFNAGPALSSLGQRWITSGPMFCVSRSMQPCNQLMRRLTSSSEKQHVLIFYSGLVSSKATSSPFFLSSSSSKLLLYVTSRHKWSFKWHCNTIKTLFMRWMMYRWWCEGGVDRAWWAVESVFLRSPDKGFRACPRDLPPDMPRRPETWISQFSP